MGILRADRVSGLGGANAITGSVYYKRAQNLRTPNHSDYALGSNDFTIECWWNPAGDLTPTTGGAGDQNFIALWNNTTNRRAWGMYYDGDTTLFGFIGSTDGIGGGNDRSTYYAHTFAPNTWVHLACVRIGNTCTIYVDGTSIGSNTSFTGSIYNNTVDPLVIGGQLTGADGSHSYDSKIMCGYMSNLRVINGDGIYTGAFTPPTNRLEKTANTVLLCNQSPGDITQEATGKDLVPYRSTVNDAWPIASHFTPDAGEDHGTTFEDNTKFDTLSYMVPPGGTTAESNRGRGVFGSGETPSNDKVMDYVQIQSMGNAIKFGDLSAVSIAFAAVSSSTRGVFAIGVSPNITMEYITFTTTSNSTDFGDQAEGHTQEASCSNNTRGLFAGGLFAPNTVYNSIEYITIATTGNDTDFGDLTRAATGVQGMSDTTRAVFGGGITGSPLAVSNIMDYVTIASTGNAADFGDMTTASRDPGALASSTRGLIGGGTTPSLTNFIDYITIQTTGNAADYGDLTAAQANPGCTSNGTRGLWATGATPTIVNSVEYTTIATLGNAADFGDLTRAVYQEDACSDSHGGIS